MFHYTTNMGKQSLGHIKFPHTLENMDVYFFYYFKNLFICVFIYLFLFIYFNLYFKLRTVRASGV